MPDDDEFYIEAKETLDFSEEETRISKNLDVRPKVIFLITIFAILVIGMLYFFSFYFRAWLLIPKMDHFVYQSGDKTEVIISINEKKCKYHYDSIIFKESRLQGQLFLKNGDTCEIKYYPIDSPEAFVILIEGFEGYFIITPDC